MNCRQCNFELITIRIFEICPYWMDNFFFLKICVFFLISKFLNPAAILKIIIFLFFFKKFNMHSIIFRCVYIFIYIYICNIFAPRPKTKPNFKKKKKNGIRRIPWLSTEGLKNEIMSIGNFIYMKKVYFQGSKRQK
jgi:hypothetical protein